MAPKNYTNTNRFWKDYPIGKYSGSKRLDPTNMVEPGLDNDFSQKLWLDDMINDEDFHKEVDKKIEEIKTVVSMTTDPNELDIIIAGQSHIDMAWKWRYEQTRQKGVITFKKAMYHAKRYPGNFNYCASEPILFDWLLEDDPEAFKELQDIVKKGGIELVGGSYVEPDCMMPSGEAFVRSRLIGMKFYKDYFNILPKVEWFLDSFGYNVGLPQILKKSGAEYFWTSKITWNRQTIFPFVNFMWKSPDGTELLTSNFKQNWDVLQSWVQFEMGRHPLHKDGLKVWNYGKKDYEDVDEDVDMDEIMPTIGVFAGKGNGGHGPTHEEVAFNQALVKKGFARWGTAEEYFEKLKPYKERLPVWEDELYLEYHRGTFSVHWDVKRHNRIFENALVGYENLFAPLSLVKSEYIYPFEQLDQVWKILLLNQFHDVLPGSSIPEVYDDVYNMWIESNEILDKLIEEWALALPVPKGAEIIISNQLSWDRNSPAFIPLSAIDKDIKLDEEGKPPYIKLIRMDEESEILIGQPCASEVQKTNDPKDSKPSGWYVMIQLKAFATKTYKVEIIQDHSELIKENILTVSENTISNGEVSIELNPKTGAIINIAANDINSGNNLVKGEESNLTVGFLDDYPMDHAWNIKPEYWKHQLEIPNDTNVKITVTDKGPVFATLNISRTLGSGEIREVLKGGSTIGENEVFQTISLFKGDPTIYLKYESDWKQPWLMLKVMYDTATDANIDTSDQCYCALERSTRPQTKPDKARYEKIMQKFADVSSPDKSWGISLLNEGKYAYDAKEGKIRLTMLRTPQYPTPSAEAWVNKERKQRIDNSEGEVPKFVDVGFIRCRYALLPHNGGALQNSDGTANPNTKIKAEEFNNPLIVNILKGKPVIEWDQNNKFFSNGTPLMSSSDLNVQISSLKQKQWVDSNNMILRIVETCGVNMEKCVISFNPELAKSIKSLNAVDLLERVIDFDFSYNSDKGELEFPIGKFEILSFELEL